MRLKPLPKEDSVANQAKPHDDGWIESINLLSQITRTYQTLGRVVGQFKHV